MLSDDELHYEVMFDPIAKSAILRRRDEVIWLEGPFRTYAEAMAGAQKHIERIKRQDEPSLSLQQ